MQSDNINELAAALSKAQGEFTAIPKGELNPFFKSKYAGLPDVVRVAAPILSANGLSISQFIVQNEVGEDCLKTYLLHSSGQFIENSMKMHLGKLDSQGQGSAVTYARRYSYMAVLGLVADEDDDGNRALPQPAPRLSRSQRHAEDQNRIGQVHKDDDGFHAGPAVGTDAHSCYRKRGAESVLKRNIVEGQ